MKLFLFKLFLLEKKFFFIYLKLFPLFLVLFTIVVNNVKSRLTILNLIQNRLKKCSKYFSCLVNFRTNGEINFFHNNYQEKMALENFLNNF